jgi:Tol biopolymer transport system component
MRADGAEQTRLTDNPAVDFIPAWSPDGREIVFSREESDGNIEVYKMAPDGNSQVNLTKDPALDLGPEWQPLPSN